MGIDLTALAIFGGAMGVGVGLGLQKITANFVSGVTLLMEKSIKIGDLIEVGDVAGWVRALNIRYALIETFDGRDLLIPNEMLMSTQVTNWTYSNERARIDIELIITFDSDCRQAQALMLAAAHAHPRCIAEPHAACFLTKFSETGQHLLLLFWVADVKEGRYGPQSDVLLAIGESFTAHGIALTDRSKMLHM
jgi:small-conductance mechanosensitive channel